MRPVSLSRAFLITGAATGYFFLLLFTLLPFFKSVLFLNPTVYWFITGYFLFVPLLTAALFFARREGNLHFREAMHSLHVRPMTRYDWVYSVSGLLLILLLTGIIYIAYSYLHRHYGVSMIQTTPWFFELSPFRGTEIGYLLIWLPMFFFNIVGEELLWRGYMQARIPSRYSWFIGSALWTVFHIPFGPDLIIMLLPVMLIVPFVFHKTRNTVSGIFIHGLYNGPAFVAFSLGMIQ